MTLTRVYLPLNTVQLRELSVSREVSADPLVAHAVTDAVRAAAPGSDDEELEYTALCDAADASAARRVAPGDPRIVAAADVDPTWIVTGDGDGSAVTIARSIALQRIASFHIDEDGAPEDAELLWYDATELAVVLTVV